MTIAIAWVRRNKDAIELLVASDSRLRSRGALNQAQKIFRLERGDCCLAFSGDAQIAYPIFMQVGSAINNYVRTRSRATDVTNMSDLIKGILNNLVASWDLSSKEKVEELAATKIMFSGWSWKHKRFDIGIFKHSGDGFSFHHSVAKLPHPWKEDKRSLVFIGDYESDYMSELDGVLQKRHGKQSINKNIKKVINFDYEPIEALQSLLKRSVSDKNLPAIGGASQLIKLYSFGNSLPIVIRAKKDSHFLLGRQLLSWEKTEYPILDLSGPQFSFLYPMSSIPLPASIHSDQADVEEIPIV